MQCENEIRSLQSKLALSNDDDNDDENEEKEYGKLESDDDDNDEPTLMSRSKQFAKQVSKIISGFILFYSGARGAPWVSKFGKPLIQKILVLASAYIHPSVQILGEGREVPRQPDWGRRNALFSCS